MKILAGKQFTHKKAAFAAIFMLSLCGLARFDKIVWLNMGYVALAKAGVTGAVADADLVARLSAFCRQGGPICARSAYGLGLLAQLAGDSNSTLFRLKQAEQLAPDNPLIAFRLADYWQRAGDEEQALTYWRRAGAHTYWTVRGDWERQEGNSQAGMEAYQLALIIDPSWEPAETGLLRLYREQINDYWSAGQFEAAIPLLQEVVRLRPAPWDYVRLGDFSRDQRDTITALSWYGRGMLEFPDYAMYPFRMGQIALTSGEQTQAVDYFKHAIRLDPKKAEAHLLLGIAYLNQGLWELAETSLLVSIDLEPDQWGYARLGDVYLAQDRLVDAENAYRQALVIAPDMTYARQKLQQLQP